MLQLMSYYPFILLLWAYLPLAAGAQTSPLPFPLAGQWRNDEEPDVIVEFYKHTDDLFYGKVVMGKAGRIPVGTVAFRRLKFDPKTGTYVGELHPPDIKSSLKVTLIQKGKNQLDADIRRFVLRKSFSYTRLP